MRTSALRDWFAISFGVALIALACGETEKDGSGSEPTSGTEDSSAGGSSSSTTSFNAQDPVVAGPVTGVTTSPLTSGTTSSGAGGSGNTSMGGSGNSAGGAPGSSAGGASGSGAGAAGAPARGCGDCEPTTESFGDDDCEVWVCFGSGAQQLVDAGCEDLATQVPRYCCPKDLSIECP